MEAQKKEHIVMVPFMAQGHLIPFLALAQRIHRTTGFTITIVNTPRNINYLRSAVSSHPSSTTANIHLVTLPFDSSDHGLPPNSENTDGLPLHQIIKLFHASAALESPLRQFISDMVAAEGRPPLSIISDVFMSWANEVARSFNIANFTFSTGGAYGTTAYLSIWQNLPHRKPDGSGNYDKFPVPGFPDSCRFEITQLHQFLRAADGEDEWSRFFQPQISLSLQSSGWLCNSVEEIEPLGLEILRKYTKLPVWCVGPLLPPKMLQSSKNDSGLDPGSGIIGRISGKESGIPPEKCLEWLDMRPKGSVLYISFGSQNTISETQMMELAKGLEDSKKPFIWVIRPPIGFDPKGEFRPEWLPPSFEDRTKEQGLMVHQWAPQLEILCHRSTGAFLSHCGWNSVFESLSQGVPMIGWPLAAEQGYNSKMMEEEMGVCVVLTRGVHSRIDSEEAKRVIEMVMDKSEDGKGEKMRRKASELGEMIKASVREEEKENGKKGSSLQAMDDFVSTMVASKK